MPLYEAFVSHEYNNLVQIKRAVYDNNPNKNEVTSPFGEFLLGCFLIGFALPMIWMNERKQVKIYKTIEQAK